MADIHWRNTMKPPRFFFMDARAALPIVLFLVHARWWTLVLALGIVLIFVMVERRDLSFAAALRTVRSALIGFRRPAVRKDVKRRIVDFRGD